jgi:tetratricopeptide (TPR) repeat protein
VRIADSGITNLQVIGRKVGNVQAQRLTWPIRSGVVPPLADCYNPRAETGPALTSTLQPGHTVVLCDAAEPYSQPAASPDVGPGGTGKTQIAAGFAYTLWEARAVDLVVWISATSKDAVLTGYAVALADVGGAEPGEDYEAAAQQFLAWLAVAGRPWLLVLDDLTDPADMEGLWPQGQTGRVLVTTRKTEPALGGQNMRITQVGVFTRREALNYLTARLSEDPDQRIGALDVAEDLGYLPLALAQAAATIADRRLDCGQYRTRFADRKQRLAGGATTDHGLTVAATWSLATDCADQHAPAGLAWPALALAALLDPNGIPAPVLVSQAASMYITGRGATGTSADENRTRTALYNLARLGVLTIDPSSVERTVRVHALVQAATQSYLSPKVLEHAGRAAASALVQAWPERELEPFLAQAFRDCAARLREATGPLLWTAGVHPVLFRAGQSLDNARLSGSSIVYWQTLVDTSSRLLGGDHPNTLLALDHLAAAYENAGRLTEAIPLFERALADHERVQGPGHADTVQARSSLASAYEAAGRPADAIGVHARCVADLERIQGADHPDTLAARESLAHVYRIAGQMKDAMPIFERALADRERVQGPDHPDTLTARGNLAYAYRLAGRIKQAIPLYRRTLADRERVQGPDHTDTLTARGNLAYAYHTARRMKEAIPLYERTLIDRERVQGPDHPDTITARGNLASAYHSAGRIADAVPLYERTLADCERTLGRGHPDTLTSRSNLAHAYHIAGRMTDAIAVFQRTLADCERVLGPDHPMTQTMRENLETASSV